MTLSDCCTVEGAAKAPAVMACPVSGTRSKRVESLTVRSLVRHLPLGMPPTEYYFCDSADCDVIYFPSNPAAPLFRRADLMVRVGIKEAEDPIPVCYCFGFTRQDIWDEIRQKGKSTIAEQIKLEVKAGNCACEVKNPSGRCCLGDIVRIVQEGARAPVSDPGDGGPSEARANRHGNTSGFSSQ